MDSLTHIVLGACIGEAIAGKELGRKALLYGAIAQSLPDIDALNSIWLDTADDVLAHRGITHSFLFVILVSVTLAFLMKRTHRKYQMNFISWLLLIAAELITHLLLDACNNYGTGWFEPFSSYRISFNILFVADPFFTIWPLIAAIALLIISASNKHRKRWWRFGILLSAAYLSYCIGNKIKINGEVKTELARQQLVTDRYFSTPTPLNNWLWYVVVSGNNGFYIGYRSVFDDNKKIDFTYFPKNELLLTGMKDQHDLLQLKKFSQGYFTVEKTTDTLIFNDLRFGQRAGWYNPYSSFVFRYYLSHPFANDVIVQRGRFAGWNDEIFHSFLQRIKGK